MATKKKVTKKSAKKVVKKPVKKSAKPLTKWQLHLNKTWKQMKKENPEAKFSDAMKKAKENYVPPKKK